MPTYAAELAAARDAAVAAARIIRRHYDAGPIDGWSKADDSPLTAADLEANDAILALISQRFPDDAILSEETADDGSRLGRRRVWIVDPLDGTRDFVARTGDFAVHVALAVDGVATVAAVHQPTADALYWAVRGAGAYVRDAGGERRLRVSDRAATAEARIGVTRLAGTDNLARFLADTGLADNTERIGASVKMLAVASGRADISLCLHGREKQWDTCAPGLLVAEAGGRVSDLDGAQFVYNRPVLAHDRGILMSNGALHEAIRTLALPYFAP